MEASVIRNFIATTVNDLYSSLGRFLACLMSTDTTDWVSTSCAKPQDTLQRYNIQWFENGGHEEAIPDLKIPTR